MAEGGAGAPPRTNRPRWGLRTLGFLVLAFVAVFTAQGMGAHTVGTLGSLLFGLIGAAYCSVRGLKAARDRGLRGLMMDRRRPR